jgi:4-amino-4-deoxy-L-arabinose transferase-like glycosyltransferase
MWRGVALILLCLVTFVLGLGQSAIQDSDEAFYAEAGREMLASGNWTTPYYNFEPRLQKPILLYWLIASTYKVVGVTEWAARIWPALSGAGLALLAALVAWRWCGPTEGWLAGAIVATSFGVVPLARQSLPDMPLAFFVSVAVWSAIEAFGARDRTSDPGVTGLVDAGEFLILRWRPQTWLYVSAAAAALGTLTKGPVAIALPVVVLAPMSIWMRRLGGRSWPSSELRASHVAVAAALFVVITVPWYAAVMRAEGIGYAWRFFIGENVERFATTTYNEWRGWMYVPVVIAGLLPWSAFALLWIRPLADWLRGRHVATAMDAWLICWALGPMAFFMISVGSQPRYILPCLPPLSILLARSIASHVSGAERGRVYGVASFLAGGLIVLIGVLLWRAARVLMVADVPTLTTGPMLITAVGVVVTASVPVLSRRAALSALTIAAAAVLVVFQWFLLSPGRPEPVETVARAIRADGPVDRLCSCGAMGRSLAFYAHRKSIIANVTADNTAELSQFLDSPDRVLAAVDGRALAAVEATRNHRFPRLTEVTYLNTSVWQRGETLIDPDPNWVQRVVLIANR